MTPNLEPVHVKGKGRQQTFWLVPLAKYAVSERSSSGGSAPNDMDKREILKTKASRKVGRLIGWNVQTLSRLLKPVVARRNAVRLAGETRSSELALDPKISGREQGIRPLEEVEDVLKLPTFNDKASSLEVDPDAVVLDPKVIRQLRSFVTKVSSLYHENPFHNFEHASHVASSVEKLLRRIVKPNIDIMDGKSAALGLHDYS